MYTHSPFTLCVIECVAITARNVSQRLIIIDIYHMY